MVFTVMPPWTVPPSARSCSSVTLSAMLPIVNLDDFPAVETGRGEAEVVAWRLVGWAPDSLYVESVENSTARLMPRPRGARCSRICIALRSFAPASENLSRGVRFSSDGCLGVDRP